MKLKRFSLAILAVLLGTFMVADASACNVYSSQFTSAFRDDKNADLNDYGRIFFDADDPNCAQSALYALEAKLENHLNARSTTFQEWLDGYLVAEIFAAAMRLGAHGWAGAGLDQKLERLEGRFTHYQSGCGGDQFNTCMDDLLGSASGYAWMAAYQTRRQHRLAYWQTGPARDNAIAYLQAALAPGSGVCIRMKPVDQPPFTPLCNGTIADLANGTAETFSVNGNQQLLAYGFGLMTSVATAIHGLEESGASFYINNDRRLVARGLMEEMQRHVDGNNEFKSDCVGISGSTFVNNVHCGGGPGAYRPNLYALKPLYDQYFNGITNAGSYRSDSFDDNLYWLGPMAPAAGNSFSYGRYATYGIMAYSWMQNRPTLMPPDWSEPKGYLEAISSSGVAQGWACDQDMPNGRIKVDFFVDGWSHAAEGWADSASEPAINWECGGGFAHRFLIQLPSWTQGKDVRAYGNDFTWIGATELPCLQSPNCSW